VQSFPLAASLPVRLGRSSPVRAGGRVIGVDLSHPVVEKVAKRLPKIVFSASLFCFSVHSIACSKTLTIN
jgi:hypothetical protein